MIGVKEKNEAGKEARKCWQVVKIGLLKYWIG